jgi:GGDEF domain-containing protein
MQLISLALFSFLIPSLSRRFRHAEAAFAHAASLASRTAGIPLFRHSLPELTQEVTRARRYQRPLSIMVLSMQPDQLSEYMSSLFGRGGNGNSANRDRLLARAAQLVTVVLGPVLRDVLRQTDIVTYMAAEDQYVILLPESDGAQAERVVERINEHFYTRTFAHLRAGIAAFPADGLTVEDLVARAQSPSQTEEADR